MNRASIKFRRRSPIRVGFNIMQILVLILAQVGGAFVGIQSAQAEGLVRDTRTWTSPDGSISITFSTLETYASCTSPGDRIFTTGVPSNWSLTGYVNVVVVLPDSTWQSVGYYPINQYGNLDLTLPYPPAWTWPFIPPPPNVRELHVDLGIIVRDQDDNVVPWIGVDPNNPGLLGPYQDWDVYCQNPSPTPEISIVKYTNGADANNPDGADVPNIAVGGAVTWTYLVSNPSSWPIHKSFITVTDNQPGVFPVFDHVVSGNGDDVLDPGEIWEYKATGLALDLTAPPAGVFVQENACSHAGNEPPRTAYVNVGTVSIDGYSASDPSSYCNPPAPTLFTLGDRVWYDQNQNGIQDANEPGYNGATVDLYANASCTGMPMASTVTGLVGPAGFYQFTDLPAGDYCVQFGNIPVGWSISPPNQGDGTNDSSANANAQIPNILLTANDPNEDMGIFVPGSLGDSVTCLTTGEPLANITISLFKDFNGDGIADGPAIATTETDANGFYQFTGLEVALAGDPINLTQYLVVVDVNDADLGACNVPVPPTSYNPPLDSSHPNDPNNDFWFELPATVGDRVWYDNNGDGVQDAGEAGIPNVKLNLTDCSGNILASDFTDTNGNYLFDGLDAGTYCVVIDATTLPANLIQTFEKDGSLDGNTQQPLTPGDVVLDVDFGFKLLAPAVDLEKYVLVIPSSSGGDLCAVYDKPQQLTMKYIGGAANVNAQDPGKVVIIGDPGTTSPVKILATNKSNPLDSSAKVFFNGQVVLDGTFVIDSTAAGLTNLETNTYFYVYDLSGNLLQSVAFHTSCSQPIQLGDIYGSAQLVAFVDKLGDGETLPDPPAGPGDDADTPPGPTANLGDTIQWTYIVTNVGDTTLENATISDDILGFICTVPLLLPGASDSCTASRIAEQYGEFANEGVVVAYSPQGIEVTDADLAHYTVPEPCAVCKGGTVELTFEYLGVSPAQVTVYDDPAAKLDKILYQGMLIPGQQFTITPRPGQTKLNTDISIYINGVFHVKIKTDCSQPIGPGLITGSFLIIEGRSKDNGLMCALNVCDPSASPTLAFKDREVKWNITNLGDLGLEISKISISWPESNGALDEVKLDGDVIHKGDFLPPSAVIDSNWATDANKRTINAGDTDTLLFKFKNLASTSGPYVIRVDFTYGCFAEISYSAGTPTGSFTCSKPIDELTMIWNGSQTTVWVTAWKGTVGSTALATLVPVSLGEALTVSGYAGSPNDVYWEIFADAAGTIKLGESTFHVSCSDPDMNSADDCGKPEGDGKDKIGFLNNWLLEGLVDSDETLVCSLP